MAGRKSKYQTHVEPNFEVILGHLRAGQTEKGIARSLGVGITSWKKYKLQFPAFMALIKKGSLDSCALCVNSLFKRANGNEYDEIHVEERKNTVNGVTETVVKKIVRHVSPDVGALVFWLINRDPKHWRNRQDIQHSGDVKGLGVLLVHAPMSVERWKKAASKLTEYQKWLQSQSANPNSEKITKKQI